MSDFFGDDFTADLKKYFLENLTLEVRDVIDLIDDSLWVRIRTESVRKASHVWAVDAKTNGFIYLAEWLEGFEERTAVAKNSFDFKNYLETLCEYVKALLLEKVDTPELAKKYSSFDQTQKDFIFLFCRFGKQDFVVPLANVVEIGGNKPLVALPDKKNGLMGVIPFRGDAIPVVNFQDYGFSPVDQEKVFYVICEFDGSRFSLQVTETDNLLKVAEADLQNIEGHSSVIQSTFIKQFFVKENKSVIVLDLEKLVAA
ncbi:MAG: chemotaxis protein CheW [Pseudobdellovibrionaceae bacterium]